MVADTSRSELTDEQVASYPDAGSHPDDYCGLIVCSYRDLATHETVHEVGFSAEYRAADRRTAVAMAMEYEAAIVERHRPAIEAALLEKLTDPRQHCADRPQITVAGLLTLSACKLETIPDDVIDRVGMQIGMALRGLSAAQASSVVAGILHGLLTSADMQTTLDGRLPS